MKTKKFWSVSCALLAFAFVGALFFANGKLTDLKLLESKKQAEITSLNAELEKRRAADTFASADAALDETEKERASDSAAELGNKVAECQNAYMKLNVSEDRDAFEENVALLDACFADSDKGARVPWYAGETDGTWTFVADGAFKGVNKNVLWLCRNPENGRLLAYATALYESESGLFSSVSHEMSVLGSEGVSSSGDASGKDAEMEKVNEIADELETVEPFTESELTDEDAADVKRAQWELRKALTGGDDHED